MLDIEISHRNEIPHLITGKIGVELGVLIGTYSECILQNSSLTTLISIDAWAWPGSSGEEEYLRARNRLAKFGSRSTLLRASSDEASALIANNSLDFVYIDADHKYSAVSNDIKNWWPKLKKGGLFSGHDYWEYTVYHKKNPQHPVKFGVVEAVTELADEYDLHIYSTKEDFAPSWYCFKN